MTENRTDENQLHLFSLEPDYKQCLIEGDVTDELKMAFKDNSCPISRNAKIIKIYEDKWKIIDGNEIYVIKDTSTQLNIYINPINFAIDKSIEFEELMDETDFDSWLDGVCLFNWNSENYDKLLIEYLNDNFKIEWVKKAKIEKIEDSMAINISTKENSISLKLDNEKTNGNLEIDGVSVREFTAKTEDDKLNICFMDSSETLEELGQCDGPFKNYEKNRNELRGICDRMTPKGEDKYPKVGDKSSLERYLIYKLFDAKIKRLEARICSSKEDEQKEYNKVLHTLLSALNALHNLEGDNTDKRWFVLLYNDLSICYAGLDNSSMSMGYAEEAMKIIEKEFEEYYKEFNEELSANNSKNLKDIEGLYFVSSKLYDLYTVALFNQALAERRSSLYTEAERNFREIIEYAEVKYIEEKTKDKKDNPLRNFNYYSALLNLSDLYMDLSRGREAIDLLHKVSEDENIAEEKDIRYWKAYLYEITALIDQSEYDKADSLLKTFKKGKSGFTLNKEHKVTSTGFKGLACYARCEIEKVKNTLGNSEKSELIKAKEIIEASIKDIRKREQTGLETKAYKQLSDIYKILRQDEEDKDISDEYDVKVIKYLIMFISEAEPKIDNLDDFILHPKRDYWIDKCDDLNALESFTDQIIKVMTDDLIDTYRDLLEKIKEKIIKECEDKDQLSRAERSVTKIEKELEGKKGIKYKKDTFDKIFRSKDNLTKKEIIARLDTNEKEFDSALFKRSKMNKPEHIAEVIVLRRWNSFSPGLYRESIGSLGGGYLLRIKKNSYLFSFSDIAKEKEMQELLNRLHSLDHSDLAEIMEGAEYSKKGEKIRITKNNKRIATVKIEGGFCYLERQGLKLKLGVVEEKDTRLFSVSTKIEKDVKNKILLNKVRDVFKDNNETLSKGATIHKVGDGWEIADERKTDTYTVRIEDEKLNIYEKDKLKIYSEDSDVENIVIDPGYNFLQNFRREGFYINDIDAIIVTHSHLDHCAELLPIMDLMFQFNKRYESTPNGERQKKKVNLCLSRGAYKKFSSFTNEGWQEQLKDVIILENLDEGKCKLFDGSTVSAIKTYHMDLGGVHSIGLKIKISIEGKKNLCLGFTGDTPSAPGIKNYFKGCDLLCVHLGSIKYQEIGYTDDRYNRKSGPRKISSKEREECFNKTYATANHLLFFGTLDFIKDCTNRGENNLIIVGEFGEELKYGLRTDLCKKLYKETKISCLPGDIGLYIGIKDDGTKKVRCNFCEEFVKPKEIKTFSYGREDAIQYICQTCNNTLSELQKHAIIKHRVTRH